MCNVHNNTCIDNNKIEQKPFEMTQSSAHHEWYIKLNEAHKKKQMIVVAQQEKLERTESRVGGKWGGYIKYKLPKRAYFIHEDVKMNIYL